jgi:hypothetical protein
MKTNAGFPGPRPRIIKTPHAPESLPYKRQIHYLVHTSGVQTRQAHESPDMTDAVLQRDCHNTRTVQLGYNVMRGTESFMSLKKSVVTTEEYNIMVNSEELIGITECVTL